MTEGQSAEALKARVRGEFDIVAATYDGQRAMRNASVVLLEAAALKPGMRVLDIATGTGFIAIPAARQVMPGGTVNAIDLSPEMIVQARRNATAAGLTNLHCEVGDAESLDFADDTFDVVSCGLSIQFLPNKMQAIREWKRVLKRGGWLHFSAWGVGYTEPLRGMLRDVLGKYGLAPQTGAGGLPEPDRCREVLEVAGLTAVTVRTEQVGFYYRDLEEYWAEMSVGPGATALKGLSAQTVTQFKADLFEIVAGVVTNQGIFRNSPVNVASGCKI